MIGLITPASAMSHEPAVDSSTLPLIAILGPTASGKSSLAVSLAERLQGDVIACDSTQVYRGFDVGTAKPSTAERRGIAHHMMDMLSPTEVFTAGEYRKRALEVLADLRLRGRLPIFTVGTGLYFRALTHGLADAPTRSDELRLRLNTRGEARGASYLHKILSRLDPVAARRIAPNDRQKLVRAVEVCLIARRPLSELHQAGRSELKGYAIIKIGLNPPRQQLYERIERRVQLMLDQGWREEVAALMAAGLQKTAKAFEFIGYRELCRYTETGDPLSKTSEAIAQATRRYAKRQLTWFRRETGVHWVEGFGDAPETFSAALGYLRPLLRRSLDSARQTGTGETV